MSGEGEEKKRENMWSRNVPEDVLMDILSTLPAKSLMRFKCISKSWYALITNPCFITKHLTSHNSHRGAILRRGYPVGASGRLEVFTNKTIEPERPRLSTLSNETLELSGDVDLSQLFQDEVAGVLMLGPCNGLLCLAATLRMRDGDLQPVNEIVLWNPATRESKMLPPMDVPTSTFKANFGFGYDPKTNDYKVVTILSFDSHSNLEVMVYSLSTNSWRVIDSSPNTSYLIHLPRYPSYLNGFHHWWAEEEEIEVGVNNDDRCLLSFDMNTEVFLEELPPPAAVGMTFGDISVINDSLAVIYPYINDLGEWIEIWVLNESGVERTWTKILTIQIPFFWYLIQLREDGLVVLCDNRDGCLVLYDTRTREQRDLPIYRSGRFQLFSYTESLVLLNGSGNVIEQQNNS